MKESSGAGTLRGMKHLNQENRRLLLAFAVLAAFELFRPAPAAMQPSMNSLMRDVVSELRGIRQELARVERNMK